MSNFLKNLARRSAGLPLAAECRPTAAPAFAGSFESGGGLNEVTSEVAVGSLVVPAARPLQTLNTAAPPQVQRSRSKPIAAATSAIGSGFSPAQNATTALQPLSSLEVVSPEQSAALFPGEATAQRASFESGSRDSRLSSPAAPAQAQITLSPGRDLPATIDSGATLQRSERNGSAWPEISVAEGDETTQQNHQLLTTEHLIRPAPTDPTLPFQFPRTATTSPQPVFPTPIEVRIGRVEVRGGPPVPQLAPAPPATSPPLGFASYHRLRRYRN